MATVGEELRSERLRQGLQVAEIAAAIKIRPELLEAIEAGHFEMLPGGAYRRSFLRQYAHQLGLDETATIASFHEQYQEPPVALPVPPPDKPSQSWRLVGALLALVLSAVVFRLVVNSSTTSGPLASIVEHATTAPTPAPAATVPAPQPSTYAQSVPNTQNVQADQNIPVRALRVAFSATEPVWVSVKCDGAQAFAGTLEGSQTTKTFDASTLVTVLVGNAGGLSILLNGKSVGPLGAHGEIEQVELTPSGVRRVPRRPAVRPSGDTVPQI